MKSSSKLPSMSTIRHDWWQTPWDELVGGDFIAVTVADQVVACGTIDTLTVDKSIAWIYPSDNSERKMCFLEDGPQVWLPPEDPTKPSTNRDIGAK